MSSPVWKFFAVAEEDIAIAICNVCSARILRGGKKASSFNTTNLISRLKGRHCGEAVLRDFKQPPLLERQWYSNVILHVRVFNCYFVAFYCRHVQRGGGRWVLEHLPLFPLMPKVPFCQGNYYFIFFIFIIIFL